jgi:hypothetical protein
VLANKLDEPAQEFWRLFNVVNFLPHTPLPRPKPNDSAPFAQQGRKEQRRYQSGMQTKKGEIR